MRLTGDFHTHTIYSHGKSTVEENIRAAIDQGLDTIAISEHGPGHIFYGVSYKKLRKMRQEIDQLKKVYQDRIRILMGIEANIIDFEGNLDIGQKEIELFDFLACGYHNGINPRGLKAKFIYSPFGYFTRIFSKDYIRELATDSMIKASHKYDLFFITHPGAKFPVNEKRLAQEVKKGVLLEINNKHGNLTSQQLKNIIDTDVNFIVNSDAHSKEAVGRVDRSLKIIKEAGLPLDRIFNLVEN